MPPISRRAAAAARRSADSQSARLADLAASGEFFATVQTVTAGAASDGNALVTVTYRAEELPAAGYPDSYTPVVGHRVLCSVVGMQLVIKQHTIGNP